MSNIFILIFLLAILAVIEIICAIRGIKGEIAGLELFIKKHPKDEIDKKKKEDWDHRAKYITKDIAELSKGKRPAHLYKRLELLTSTLRNGAGRLPELDDLNEITENKERCRRSVLIWNLIISTLLIIGILGTLCEVHSFIGEATGGKVSIKSIKPTLEPSALAVFSTIVLTILRGYYNRLVDFYLGKLNIYTLTTLAPFLQPVSQTNKAYNNLAVQLEACAGGFYDLKNCIDTLKSANGQLKDIQFDSERLIQEWKTYPVKLEGMVGDLDNISGSIGSQLDLICERGRNLSDNYKGILQNKLFFIKKSYSGVGKKIEDSSKSYEKWLNEWQENQESYNKNWKKIIDSLAKTDNMINQLRNMGNALLPLKEIESVYGTLATKGIEIRKLLEPVSQQGKDASEHTKEILKKYNEAKKAAESVRDNGKSFCDRLATAYDKARETIKSCEERINEGTKIIEEAKAKIDQRIQKYKEKRWRWLTPKECFALVSLGLMILFKLLIS